VELDPQHAHHSMKENMMENKSTEIAPRHTELIPRRVQPPLPSRRPPVHRTWLRDLFVPAPVHSYIAPGEQCLIATRRHWVVPLWRLARGGGMMTVIGVLTVLLPGYLLVQLALALGALAHTAWVLWCVLAWRVEQIAVTNTRLIRVAGILTTTVDTVPLAQITDMSMRRTIVGHILRYGTLRVETAGQDGALKSLHFLPSAVCHAMLSGHDRAS